MDLLKQIDKFGYVVLENLGLDDPDRTLTEYMSSIAKPISYLGLPLVMDLKPQPGYQPASFAGTGEFNMHTDLSWYEKPPRYIGMFCVSPESANGGIPLLADGWQALKSLPEADIQFLTTEAVTFPTPNHIDYPSLSGPIISQQADGRSLVRFRFDMLPDPPPPVCRYFAAINRHVFHVDVARGTLFIVDNHRMLHGRTELRAGMYSDRFFKRIYGD